MSEFEKTIDTLKTDIATLAKESLEEFSELAIKETNDFFETTKADLKKWTEKLAAGLIDKGDLEYLIESNIALTEMKIQTQIGLAKIKADTFMAALKDMAVTTLIKFAQTAGI